MSDIIQLLPDSVANQIAAGEVIQRPASVLKELVENAVDASARNINVIVVDAGRTSIQVIDDGMGMSETDARLAFERHATSKIRKADDLFALRTMGFRGEALASIAAVAQVELKTRREDDEVGTHLSISGSRVLLQEPVACPVGSNFSVENLFFNVPARRKFLKSNSTELNNMLAAFERIVLVNPQINFTFHSNEVEVFDLRTGSYRQRIIDVFGKKINQDLLPVEVETTVCRIHGFVGKPESARKKGVHQFFFVNGRYMKHPYFHKAVMSAFDRLVPTGDQIPYFIYINVEPGDIDVNIHPTKTEIKFENEQAIWQILAAAVKEAVGKFNEVPPIDFDTVGRPDIPPFGQQGPDVPMPEVSGDPQYNPFKQDYLHHSSQHVPRDWESLYRGLEQKVDQQAQQPELFDSFETKEESGADIIAEKSPVHYQYKGCYIMTAVKSGLMVIDQHRAHMRVLYEKYLQQKSAGTGTSQKMLFPEVVQFPPSEVVFLQRAMSQLESFGFELSDLGGGSYAINSVPAGIDGINMVNLLKEMVGSLADETTGHGDIAHRLALCMARQAAIPYGQVLGNDEMENIVNQLFSCSNVNYTPDGKLVLNILPQREIDGLLG